MSVCVCTVVDLIYVCVCVCVADLVKTKLTFYLNR